MQRVRAAVAKRVPEGVTVLFTVTAPIRLAAKTAAEIEERLLDILSGPLPRRDVEATIYGNGVRIRIVRNRTKRGAKVLGFVHNPDCDSRALLDGTSETSPA